MADVVLWSPATPGAKPWMRCRACPRGTVDPELDVDVAEPRQIAAQFGGIGGAAVDLSVILTNAAAVESGDDAFLDAPPPRGRARLPRRVARLELHHRASASVSVDPSGAGVSLDGNRLHAWTWSTSCRPAACTSSDRPVLELGLVAQGHEHGRRERLHEVVVDLAAADEQPVQQGAGEDVVEQVAPLVGQGLGDPAARHRALEAVGDEAARGSIIDCSTAS
ncbi:MAG: hypothetical protein U0R76_07165 [Candidatus Nanopelagicales bacterium]